MNPIGKNSKTQIAIQKISKKDNLISELEVSLIYELQGQLHLDEFRFNGGVMFSGVCVSNVHNTQFNTQSLLSSSPSFFDITKSFMSISPVMILSIVLVTQNSAFSKVLLIMSVELSASNKV